MKSKVIAVVGPTASGKTKLAIELAHKMNGEIISADSRLVYKGFNIAAAKPTIEEMEGIPHHLIDIVEPEFDYTAGDYARDAKDKIDEILSRGKTPIVAGGTGLYFRVLLEHYNLPQVETDYALREELEQKSREELLNDVKILDEKTFETITKDVSNGGSTTNKVIQAGKNGIKEVTYKVKYKDELEIERIEISSKIIKEPVNKIVQIQTKVTSRFGSRFSGVTTASSGRYKVTAYCACVRCCGKTNGITASGTKATANRTIAAPSSFAFGTKVIINGQTYTVEDRGGAIQGNRIDVYMNSHSEALAWGVRYLDVQVLN